MTIPSSRSVPSRSGDPRERIERTAYELFSRHGTRAIGVDTLAGRAGVAKMTLYKHYRSKDDLVLAFLRRREELWTRTWLQNAVRDRSRKPAARLLGIFELFDSWFRKPDYEGCAFLKVLLERIPIEWLQLGVGVSLLVFGVRWLRKAILRAAGVIALHDETAAFTAGSAELRRHESRLDWLAGLASFKAVLLEGLEVAFIVVAVGAGRGLLFAASVGAVAACALVTVLGLALRRPLARVPENQLKFAVGVMLSAFGVFWTGEGLGVAWPLDDLAIIVLGALFLAVALLAVVALKRPRQIAP